MRGFPVSAKRILLACLLLCACGSAARSATVDGQSGAVRAVRLPDGYVYTSAVRGDGRYTAELRAIFASEPQLLGMYFMVLDIDVIGDKAVVLARPEAGSAAQVLAVDPDSLEVTTLLDQVSKDSIAAVLSPDGRYVAVLTLTEPGLLGAARLSIHDLGAGTFHDVSLPDGLTSDASMAFGDGVLAIASGKPGDCLVNEVGLVATSTATCAVPSASLMGQVDSVSWDTSELLALCDGRLVLALSAPHRSADFELVLLGDDGSISALGVIQGQNPTVSCRSGGVAVIGPAGAGDFSQFEIPHP
ncbi:MAG: hypothetical protein Q7V57_06275 [Actinomycetota bacterium]|nr:hypothetical protein [Actinomycetota bacterium]